MFRYNTAVIDESNPNTRALIGASRAINTHKLDHTAILSWTRTISSKAINQLHYQYNYSNYLVTSAEKFGPEININGYGYFNSDALLPSRLLWRRQEFREKLSLVRGKHTLKLGGDLLIRRNLAEARVYFPGRFNFGALPGSVVNAALASTTITALQAFNLGIPQNFQQSFGEIGRAHV